MSTVTAHVESLRTEAVHAPRLQGRGVVVRRGIECGDHGGVVRRGSVYGTDVDGSVKTRRKCRFPLPVRHAPGLVFRATEKRRPTLNRSIALCSFDVPIIRAKSGDAKPCMYSSNRAIAQS
jgi:hypothetical protein